MKDFEFDYYLEELYSDLMLKDDEEVKRIIFSILCYRTRLSFDELSYEFNELNDSLKNIKDVFESYNNVMRGEEI